ncbi:SAS6-like protein [Plasmodium yoelii yoelii]|uniref:SAS6-like protein n=1 Tax=Plasmodium yoelii yoelii TaxID=73239 RepID=A0AAF0B7B6_PLAYO|nr:SAS6-like protein [Plasmodium yoelii yoelii]
MNKNDMNNFLCQFDFSSLEDLDPSIADGYHICYNKEVPFEIKISESENVPKEIGNLENITVKLLVLGEELNAQSIKIELTSESDLFFHFTQIVDENIFDTMQDKQKLMISFSEYLEVLIKMFNSCVRDPQSFLAIFTIKQNGKAQLDFIKVGNESKAKKRKQSKAKRNKNNAYAIFYIPFFFFFLKEYGIQIH